MLKVITEKSAKKSARIGPRATYGASMYESLKNGAGYMLLSADLAKSSGLDRVSKEYPDNFINCGIAEQNMVAFASGLVREGHVVFASSFAPFLTMRAIEHVRINLGYMGEPVVLVGLGSGFSLTTLGNSHYGLEDIAMMRSIPGIQILAPADAGSIPKVISAAADSKKPTYIRLTGIPGSPPVYLDDYDFRLGSLRPLEKFGRDVAIIATGSVLAQCKAVSLKLLDDGIKSSVFDCHTLSPIDKPAITKIFNDYSYIFTVEEHFLVGGLFSILAELKAQGGYSANLKGIGLRHQWLCAGSYEFMQRDNGLDVLGIHDQITEALKLEK